jgi:hypothetical protein
MCGEQNNDVLDIVFVEIKRRECDVFFGVQAIVVDAV